MATSGLRSKPKRTNAEIFKERLENNPALRDLFSKSNPDEDFERLTYPMLEHHVNIRKLYREYGEHTRQRYDAGKSTVRPESLEIALGTPIPPLGTC